HLIEVEDVLRTDWTVREENPMSTSPADPTRSNDLPRPSGRRAALLAAALCLALAAAAVRAPAQKPAPKAAQKAPAPAQAQDAQAPADMLAAVAGQDPPSGKVFKNITVLQDVPVSQMGPIMHVMRASLGVRCDYCHVIDGERYDIDIPAKEVSRQMIRM